MRLMRLCNETDETMLNYWILSSSILSSSKKESLGNDAKKLFLYAQRRESVFLLSSLEAETTEVT